MERRKEGKGKEWKEGDVEVRGRGRFLGGKVKTGVRKDGRKKPRK